MAEIIKFDSLIPSAPGVSARKKEQRTYQYKVNPDDIVQIYDASGQRIRFESLRTSELPGERELSRRLMNVCEHIERLFSEVDASNGS